MGLKLGGRLKLLGVNERRVLLLLLRPGMLRLRRH